MSRTPLREGFKVLASEGLIEILPNRGATVAPLTIEDLQEVVDVLGGLEAVVGRLAAEKIDAGRVQKLEALHRAMLKHHRQHDLPAISKINQQIHLALVEATGNRTLLDTYTALNLRIRRFRYLANLASDRWAQAVSEHEEIIQACVAATATPSEPCCRPTCEPRSSTSRKVCCSSAASSMRWRLLPPKRREARDQEGRRSKTSSPEASRPIADDRGRRSRSSVGRRTVVKDPA